MIPLAGPRSATSKTPPTRLARRILKILPAVALAVLWLTNAGAADPADAIAYRAPIRSLWRDPGSAFIIQTDYGEFRYLGDETAVCDGGATFTQPDPGQALLKAVFFHADGMAVDFAVSARCHGVLVGLKDVAAPLVPVPAPAAESGGS